MKEIYLDSYSTTKVKEESAKRAKLFMEKDYGNPSSTHKKGEIAKSEIEKVRIIISEELSAEQNEIIFTSGATESNNLAILGLAEANPNKRTIITSTLEHPSILETCNYLQKKGYNIIKIKPSIDGVINPEDIKKAIEKNKRDCLLISIIHISNIIGTIQDIKEIGHFCKRNNIFLHTDAVQSFGKIKINVKESNIDLLSASGHKIGAPKGIGFLYIKKGIKIQPIIHGGGQEKGLRSGTENVSGIAGLGEAIKEIKKVNKTKIEKSRNSIIEQIKNLGGKINGSIEKRLYNNIHCSFIGYNSEQIINYLSTKNIFVSSGSACDSKKEEEDEVLKSINLNKEEINGSLRITLSEPLKKEELIYLTKELKNALKHFELKR